VPLTVVLMSVLGGVRHWAGPAVGAIAITWLLYFFTAGIDPLVGRAAVGIILVVVILFMPQGLLGFLLKRRKLPTRSQIATPTPTPAPTREHATTAATGAMAPARRVVPADGVAPLLDVRGLSKSFKGVQALDSVSLVVRPGEILGLLGPNGSGKSTFINVVSGHFPASAGEIRYQGSNLAGIDAHRIARAGIARTYQIPRPFAHLTVLQNVALTAMFGGAALDERQSVQEAWRWLEFTGLEGRAGALPDALNLHQRKFLELARALASRPRLVLLDEVLSGLTPSEINDAIELIRRIRDRGATIVFVEHVMRAVMALADRVVVLNHGRLIAEGPCELVMKDAEVVRAYLGAAYA
jgi:branched-chain amino acid transport system permease protein